MSMQKAGKAVANVRLVKKHNPAPIVVAQPEQQPLTGEDLFQSLTRRFQSDVLVLRQRRHEEIVHFVKA